MKHFNQLTPAQAERLALLAEELGEAQQAIGKILRHGYESRHPSLPQGIETPTNRESLEREIGDVNAAVGLLIDSGDVGFGAIDDARKAKLARVGHFMHHQRDVG